MEKKEIEVYFSGGKRVEAKYKNHVIKTDQPVHQGGEDSAPAPFDLFLASIATCSGLYVLSFCQERGIQAENIRLVVKPEKNPETKMVDKISIDIHLPAEFPEKYIKAVKRAVDACTVKAHILTPPRFEIKALLSE